MLENFLQRLSPTSLFGLFMLGSFCTCITLVGLVMAYKIDQALNGQRALSEEGEIRVIAGTIEQAVQEQVDFLEHLSRSPHILDSVLYSSTDNKNIDEYLPTFNNHDSERAILILDMDMGIIYSNRNEFESHEIVNSNKKKDIKILFDKETINTVGFRKKGEATFLDIAVPIHYGTNIEGILVSELAIEHSNIFSAVGTPDRRIALSDGSISVYSADIFDESRWIWKEQALRVGNLRLAYGFETASLQNQQADVLRTTLIWLILVFIFSFVTIYVLGRRVLLNPYKELNRSHVALAAKADQLQASEQQARQLALVAENATDAIVITDADGFVRWVNGSFCAMTEYRPEEIIGRKPGHLLQGPKTDPSTISALSRMLSESERVFTNVINYTKSGKPYWVEMDIVPILNRDGKVEQFIAIERDITERTRIDEEQKQALEAAEIAAKKKSQFFAMMSHEIRTPMNGVLGSLGLLHEMPLSKKEKMLVNVAKESGEFLLTILNDILDFSKLEAGKLKLESVAFDIRKLVDSTVQICYTQASEKNLQIEHCIADDVPPIVAADPCRIRQMLLNLLTNAIKFTESGHVLLRVEARPSANGHCGLSFAVKDTGIGIPEDQMECLFKNFSQVGSSAARRYGGTGLGLAIIKLLVNQMNGRVWCESQEGQGSTFSFAIPAKIADQEEVESIDDEEETKLCQSGLRILLAEDNQTNQLIAESILRGLGCYVDAVANGKEVLDVIGDYPYDLVLMDVQMPEIDGLEATRQIRNRSDNISAIPIIALTANVMVDEKAICLSMGMNDFVSKPVSKQALAGAINRIVRQTDYGSERSVLPNSEDCNRSADKKVCIANEDARPLLDKEVFERLLNETSVSMKSEILSAVQADLEKRSKQAKDAIEINDYDELEQICHSLKGCASSIGLVKLHELSENVEKACQQYNEDLISDNITEFFNVIDKSIDVCSSA